MAPKAGNTADVTFDSAEDMQWAIETHSGVTKIRGHTLTLKPSSEDPCTAVVGGLPADIDGDELSVLFSEQDAGEGEEVEAPEPPKKKKKVEKAAAKKTSSAAAADSSDEDEAAAPAGSGDKTFEVRYADPAHAAKAAKKLNEAWWDDEVQVRVKLGDDDGARIFVRIAAAGVTWQDVKAFCESIGPVAFATEKGKGKGKGKPKGKPIAQDSDSSEDEGGKGKGKGKSKSKTVNEGKFKVKFYDPKHAAKAVKKLHDAWWNDDVQAKVKADKECHDGATVIVKITAAGLDWRPIKDWCEQIGPAIFAKDMNEESKGKGFGKGKGYGKGKGWDRWQSEAWW